MKPTHLHAVLSDGLRDHAMELMWHIGTLDDALDLQDADIQAFREEQDELFEAAGLAPRFA